MQALQYGMKSLCTAILLLCGGFAGADNAKTDARFRQRILPLLQENCVACHGALKTAGLDLRANEGLRKGGAHGGVIVPGSAMQSRLYRYVAGLDKIQMPPAKCLSPVQVADIKAWIEAGADWPSQTGTLEARPWAFRPPVKPALPEVKNTAWLRNPIDAFVLAKLEAKGLQPAPPADRRTLLRRATLDLTGLPPTPEEVEAFVRDRSSDAYEKLVDRLLAGPRYGERWARHWLDLARYAESEGFKSDEMRPNAWRYRDYVIQSLNADKPYNRFLQEQIAGDELFPDDPDALIATGFCRHWADESNARNLMLRRQEILNDITDTVGSTVLGLTMGCARCHNHKYDPITQKDYYRLQAFFAAVHPREDIPLVPREQRESYRKQFEIWQGKTADLRARIAELEAPLRQKLYHDHANKMPPDVLEAIDALPENRTPLQWLLFRKAEPQIQFTTAELTAAMKPKAKVEWTELTRQLTEFEALKPAPPPVAQGITDIGPVAPTTSTLAVGVYNAPMEEVQPGLLNLLDPNPLPITPMQTRWEQGQLKHSTGRRAALANWIARPDNPFTARVMVNRLWNYHFGRGLAGTPSDFGSAGERPTHPELLDWLAFHFVEKDEIGRRKDESHPNSSFACDWSLKKMHRLILLSNTYRQAAVLNSKAAKLDPENTLLWRFRRQRMEGEVIRDATLYVSGELNEKRGGPSIFPELPAGITTRGYWKESADPKERNRRSIYVFVKRNLRFPLFEAFDMPDTHEPCPRRQVTTTAPQSLMLLNDVSMLRSAQAFAERVAKESGASPAAQIERAYTLAFCRPPNAEERQEALTFLRRQAQAWGERSAVSSSIPPTQIPASMNSASYAALRDFCHALLNANEFLYVE